MFKKLVKKHQVTLRRKGKRKSKKLEITEEDMSSHSSEFSRNTRRRMSVKPKNKGRTARQCLVQHEENLHETEDQTGRAQKLDGGYFEEFTVLDEKQSELVKEAAKGTLKREKQQSIPSSYHKQIFQKPNRNESFELYKELLYTTINRLGKRKHGGDALTDGEIFAHGKEVFGITSAEHKLLLEEVKAMKPPSCYLNVKVLAGDDLAPKDANGFSDPYCMLCLLNSGEGDKVSDNGMKKKKKLLRQIKHETDVQLSKIKLKTLNPEWKENFKFAVTDLQEQVIRLDMWDKDDNTVVLDSDNRITSIKGFRGAGRFFKEIVQATKGGSDTLDDFMGLVEIPLKEKGTAQDVDVKNQSIPEDGMDAWFPLEPRSSKTTVQGRIHLKLTLSAREEPLHTTETEAQRQEKGKFQAVDVKVQDADKSNISCTQTSNEVYKQFLHHFARYDCQKAMENEEKDTSQDISVKHQPRAKWDCFLTTAACAILVQYRIQHEITLLESAVIYWEVFSRLYQDAQLQLDYLTNSLEKCREHLMKDELKTEQEKDMYADSLVAFCDYSLKLLEKYRYIFSSAEKEKCIELGKVLMILHIIFKMQPFQQKFPDRRLKSEIEHIIEKSTTDWFSMMVAFHSSVETTSSAHIQHLVSLTNTINADLTRGLEVYAPIFNVIRVNYLPIVFNKLETLLAGLIENGTAGVTELKSASSKHHDVGTGMFELYLAVRTFHHFKANLTEEEQNAGGIDHFSEWFRQSVVKWLDMATVKAEERIIKAVDLEEEKGTSQDVDVKNQVRVIDSMVKHSTSAVDVSCCLGQVRTTLDCDDPQEKSWFRNVVVKVQICEFYNRLDWPDPNAAYMFLTQITGIVGKSAMDYAELILRQLREKGFYDDIGQFDVTDQLCIMMNNTAHVLQFMDFVPKALNYSKVMKQIEELHGVDRAVQLEGTLKNILNCAKDDMRNKQDKIIDHIVVKMKESLRTYMLRAITSTQLIDKASDDMFEYIDNNLVTLSQALLQQVFDSIILKFWDMTVTSMHGLAKSHEKKFHHIHYKRMDQLLGIALDFFHGDGNGIEFGLLMTGNYKKTFESLVLNKSSTEELIEKFFMDRCNEQNASQKSLGSIAFKVFYDSQTKKLNVYVMNCRNLLPMDNSGSSDPYVTLRLLPAHLFPSTKSQKTKVQKDTLFPLFDESFQFDMSPPDCLKQGATLLFTVYDQDLISDNDIAGEAYFDVQNVVGLTPETSVQGSFSTVQQLELPLIIGSVDGDTVQVLKNRRANDQVAEQFVAKQKERRKKMKENTERAKQMVKT